MAYTGPVAAGYEPDDEKRAAIQRQARENVGPATPLQKAEAGYEKMPFALQYSPMNPFRVISGGAKPTAQPSRESTGKVAAPAQPAGGTGVGGDTSGTGSVLPWDKMAAAQGRDFADLNKQYRTALAGGRGTEFVKGAVPTWGASEMDTINAGIRARGKAGATLDKVPTGANVSVTEGFDYAGQLAKLQAIDPEKYGGAKKSGLPAGYTDLDTSTMSFGELAATAAKNRALMKGQEKQTALQIAQAQKGDNAMRDRLYGAQADTIEAKLDWDRKLNALRARMIDPNADAETRAAARAALAAFGAGDKTDTMAIRAKTYSDLVGAGMPEEEARAAAGFGSSSVEGYADGGLIRPFGGAPQPNTPMLAEYGQYLQSAAQAKVPPVPFAQYINLLSQTRGQMGQTPSQFADGGEVEDDTPVGAIDVSGKKLVGPGTGRSDSIPAVIDGSKPAALSTGEFVIPAHVVRAKGTEFFDKLIAQYADNGGQDNGK